MVIEATPHSIHEMGHAVMAWHLGIEVEGITVDKKYLPGNKGGRVIVNVPHPVDEKSLREYVLIGVSGISAQKILDEDYEVDGRDDLNKISNKLKEFGYSYQKIKKYIAQCEKEAIDILSQPKNKLFLILYSHKLNKELSFDPIEIKSKWDNFDLSQFVQTDFEINL